MFNFFTFAIKLPTLTAADAKAGQAAGAAATILAPQLDLDSVGNRNKGLENEDILTRKGQNMASVSVLNS